MKDILRNPIEYFRLKAAGSASSVSVGNMNRAIDNLAGFATGVDLTFGSFDESFLGEWVARQFFEGYHAKTIAYNVSKIAALYNKAVEDRMARHNDAFSKIVAKLKDVGARFDGGNHAYTFTRLRHILLEDDSSLPRRQLARDMTIFSLINGGMTFSQMAAYRKDQYTGNDGCVKEIVARYSKPRNKYLFPLGQSHHTPKQLIRLMDMIIGDLLATAPKQHREADVTLVNLWCDIAMECGIPASEISACVGDNGSDSPLTYFATSAEISSERKAEIRAKVASTLYDNPLRWYAMHLRKHADFNTLTQRLREEKISLEEIYYPMEEILRKVGNRKIFATQPVISWLVFFRARITQLNQLYSRIGDLAWGYRHVRDVRSPYAVIPNDEVRCYQQAIGTLTTTTEIIPDEAVSFSEGDYLVVLGGLMNGRHAIFMSEKRQSDGKTGSKIVYRVKLAGGNNANWVVDWDPRLVKKITEAQYNELDRQFLDSLSS